MEDDIEFVYIYIYTDIYIYIFVRAIVLRDNNGADVYCTFDDVDELAHVRWGRQIGGGREGVQAGRETNILPQIDHQQIHMRFGLHGPLWNYFETKNNLA